MTIAEEQIKRLAQEAHAFAREAHAVASVMDQKLADFEAKNLPVIEVAKTSTENIAATIEGLQKQITDLQNVIQSALPGIANDMRALDQKIAVVGAQVTALQYQEQVVPETAIETTTETAAETVAQG